MSKFFAKKIVDNNIEYKINELIQLDTTKDLKNNLEIWFKSDIPLFENSSSLNFQNNDYYFGDDGKRKAVIRFLSNAREKTNQVLLLYSDESMSWMMDEKFAKEWSKLLLDVLKNNNKIKIIHTISRDYSEIFDAVSKWIPMYLTGMIEPYYFPKLRDGIIRRTIFISSDEAIVSNSVCSNTDEMLNIYITNTVAIASLKKEFNNYLSLCKPLINLLNNCDKKEILNLYNLYNSTPGNVIIDSYSLSFISMPDDIIVELLNKENSSELVDLCLKGKKLLLNNLNNYFVLDILAVAESFSSTIPYCFIQNAFYSKENYINHLKNIVKMLVEHENYHVYLNFNSLSSSSIYIKEDNEMIIEKNNSSVLLSKETNIIKAFWEHYLQNKPESKKETINFLSNLIKNLEK